MTYNTRYNGGFCALLLVLVAMESRLFSSSMVTEC